MAGGRAVHWDEWRSNWTLVLACAVGFSFSSILTYAFGLFIVPLSDEFGWSRAQTSVGLTLTGVVSVLLSPVVGMLIDRWGVRRLAIPGLVLLTLSVASFSLADGTMTQWIALWAVFALVDLSVKSTVWTTAVAFAFKDERSLAIAFTLGGVSLASIVGPPLAATLITALGWRLAFVAIAAIWGSVALILALLFLKDTKERQADGSLVLANRGTTDADGLTVRQALRSGPLIRIGIATFVTMLLGLAVQVHQVPVLTDGGMDARQAAYLVSLAGVAGIAGKLMTGWLMDRVNAGMVGAVTLAVSAIGYGLLLESVRTVPLTIVAMMVIGYAAACKLQICAYMTSRYAGMRKFGTVFGIMSSLIALGGGLGPLLAGAVFDTFGSYDPLLFAAMAGTFLSAGLLVGLGHYPEWRADKAVPAYA
jgi:predicted MFS family arabinose efflux permease